MEIINWKTILIDFITKQELSGLLKTGSVNSVVAHLTQDEKFWVVVVDEKFLLLDSSGVVLTRTTANSTSIVKLLKSLKQETAVLDIAGKRKFAVVHAKRKTPVFSESVKPNAKNSKLKSNSESNNK